MGVIETKIYVCDGCGKQSEKSDFNTGSVCGSSSLHISGSKGGMAYNGDWGGSNHDVKMLLCFSCADKAFDFLKSLKIVE